MPHTLWKKSNTSAALVFRHLFRLFALRQIIRLHTFKNKILGKFQIECCFVKSHVKMSYCTIIIPAFVIHLNFRRKKRSLITQLTHCNQENKLNILFLHPIEAKCNHLIRNTNKRDSCHSTETINYIKYCLYLV